MLFTKSKSFILAAGLTASLLLTGCGQEEREANHLKIGVMAGNEQQLAEAAKKVAEDKYGLTIELVTFNDFVLPNEALNLKDLDINVFQHKPYLDQQIKERGYKLAIVGNAFVYPIAGYSKKFDALDKLPKGAQIALPNDPTNLGRSLLLLQQAGLINLKDNIGLTPTIIDVIDNPKGFELTQVEAPQLTRLLDDPKVAMAIINTVYASSVNLYPEQDGILVEGKESPYVNVIVAREDNKDSPEIKQWVEAFHSEEVQQAAREIFKGAAIKGW